MELNVASLVLRLMLTRKMICYYSSMVGSLSITKLMAHILGENSVGNSCIKLQV